MPRDPIQPLGRPRTRLSLRAAWWTGALALVLLSAFPLPAAALSLEPFRGHIGLGYCKLFASEAPGGSLSGEGGLDYPVAERLRVGVSFAYDLLGSRTVERGSLVASLDYSSFTAAAMLHWRPAKLGPVARVSAGLAVVNAHVDLSTSGGGALFADLAVSETAPGVAFDATVMSRHESPVRIGIELGARVGFLEDETWTLGTVRVVFHY